MRQIITSVISALAVLMCIISGCSKQSSERNILTSFYPIYISTLNVVGDIPGVKIINMTQPQTGCLHDYQLTPQDMKALSSAWAFVINGAGMEMFLDKALNQYPELAIVDASEGIALIPNMHYEENHNNTDKHNEKEQGVELHNENHDHGEYNPHVFVSISGAIDQVKNIEKGLERLDPGNADRYRQNATRYINKLLSLNSKMHDSLKTISTRNIVTFHEAFPYFAKEFDLTIIAVVEREPGSEPSARELAHIIDTIKENGVQALFIEPQYPDKTAYTIARETGAKVYTLDPSVSGPDTPDAYLQIMESNLKVLQEALK